MIHPNQVTAIVVTKGGRDLTPVLDTLKPFAETIVWDNSQRQDFKVLGRFRAIPDANTDIIYFQDDDCITDPLAILSEYRPGYVLCNMTPAHSAAPFYQWRIKLLGFGSLFSRWDVDLGFTKYLERYEPDDLFQIECDRIFTALSECITCHVPIVNLDYASAPDRLWKQPDHGKRMQEINRRLRELIP